MAKFYRIHVEITNICNLQCSFCPEVVRTKRLMPLPLFRTIIKDIAPLTKVVALHLMGDPLVHPELKEIVEICHEHSLSIFFVTNGVLLRAADLETLLHPAFRQINFSLHSFPDNFGDKDPTAYLEKIFAFTETAFARRPKLFINYRLWNLAHPRGFLTGNRDILRRIEERFGIRVPAEVDTRVQKYFVVKNKLSLAFDTEFIWPSLDLPELGEEGTCYGLTSHFGVLVDGTVVPCCLDKEAAIPLGKIPDTTIREILASPRARGMVDGFRAGKLQEDLCRRCQYIDRFRSKVEVEYEDSAVSVGALLS